ncbi:F-box only protein 34 [Echinops telfairi]|uniref:F-box only protein 34 n=4 Tax=Echinops telfairi TaxID=9371 RepID=A0AC55CWI8_ECHTE|nr:F-box only protein 34 [Echinops telfairi]XP_045143852.1 F-box only protein 34 [Echinops telfairi]XP_045143853.1 F-box only protein 34 [Echinops telfairi]XP_045143854.1 F-box only protein 34 [Echinops telfairi]
MHLKPHWQLQKEARSLDITQETWPLPMRHPRAVNEEACGASLLTPSIFPSASCGKASSRQPFGIISPNVLCSMSGKSPAESSLSLKAKKHVPSATIHQGEDGDGPLDIWAVVKPGNTKEKIAFFAAHQGSTRIGSMKIKSSWDLEGRATKRRKRSGDLRKAKVQLERMREVNSRCYPPEPFACGIEHCSVHYVSDSGDGVYAGRPLSVIQMVAFLEQRASALLASCTKTCTSAPTAVRLPGHPRGVPPAFPAPGACDAVGERGTAEAGEAPTEPVRVLDMVARLESECLKRQSPREPGSLSRSSSFRRNVGRVLLAGGTQADEGKTSKGAVEAPGAQGDPVGSASEDCGPSSAEQCSPKEDQAWEDGPLGCPSLPAGVGLHVAHEGPEAGQRAAMKNSSSRPDVEMTEELIGSPFPPHTCPQATELPPNAVDCTMREFVPLTSQTPAQRRRESGGVIIAVSKAEQKQPSSLLSCGDPLPGRLFFLPPGQPESHCSQSDESTRESSEGSPLAGAPAVGVDRAPKDKGAPAEPCVAPALAAERALPVVEASSWKKQVSHDFLETRFKIQQLLEPQQYLAFLPHHIMVKIFRLLPTKSLVALKCTCCYFKFIIEYYNIRPADSRWVRDPRYREDPCKQCKKKYVKGDVSLCRWHPKPYCQALPYGPGYWMCCHRSQKGFPGCRLGLHDNRWVPACHSLNRAMHKKAKGAELEEDDF